MKEVSINSTEDPVLDDEEKNRLVKFFDVLIEMDFENQRISKAGTNERI